MSVKSYTSSTDTKSIENTISEICFELKKKKHFYAKLNEQSLVIKKTPFRKNKTLLSECL